MIIKHTLILPDFKSDFENMENYFFNKDLIVNNIKELKLKLESERLVIFNFIVVSDFLMKYVIFSNQLDIQLENNKLYFHKMELFNSSSLNSFDVIFTTNKKEVENLERILKINSII